MSPSAPLAGVHTVTHRVDGDRATIVLRRSLRHPPERIWQALTDPVQLRQWQLSELTVEGRVGGRVELKFLPSGVNGTGRVVAWEPPRVLEYDWGPAEAPGDRFPGEGASTRWELTPVEGGTLLTLTNRNLTKHAAEIFLVGGPYFQLRLEAYLDGLPMPAWESRADEARRFEFVSASGRAP